MRIHANNDLSMRDGQRGVQGVGRPARRVIDNEDPRIFRGGALEELSRRVARATFRTDDL
jgi:hypothetical protein